MLMFNVLMLLQREHNETLAKLNFVLVLTNCVLDLAASRTAPLAALVDSTVQTQPQSETTRKAEQLVLLVRALQLLGSGLTLATQQLKSGQLRPSSMVKNGKLKSEIVEFVFDGVLSFFSRFSAEYKVQINVVGV